ncbi:MAG TPA: hypothetical protein VNN73_22920, partial [Blastocatellia bacterium]|nr:hypothetical protein [Blastocatellia bacterium]
MSALAMAAFNKASDSADRSSPLSKSSLAARQEDTLADRIARVTRIRISPIKIVGYQDQVIIFSAVPTDALDNVIQGVKFTWESSNPDKVQIDDAGRATFLQPGLARITCRAGLIEATAPVLVRPGHRPVQTDIEWRLDQAALNANGTVIGKANNSGASTRLLASLTDNALIALSARSNGYNAAAYSDTTGSGLRNLAGSSSKTRPAPGRRNSSSAKATSISATAYPQNGGGGGGNDFPYDELWSEPRNLTGSPRNRIIEPTRIGPVLPESSNFEMAIPIVSVGGRGIGASVALSYNSRVWSRHGNAVTFDAIQSWPSPGFTLGFGRIVAYGPANATKYILIDPDGTRRYLGVGGTRDQNVTLQTQDGTHITYVGNGSWGGTLYYPNGTRATISLDNNRLVTTQITDTNGNYFTIIYNSVTCEAGCFEYCYCPIYWPPLTIDHITDSLGRIIQFNYDADLKLISITAPGFGGTVQNPVTRTVAQFDYESRTVSGNFSGLTVENRPITSVSFIKHIYFPATQTGLLFSYSDFGMATSVSLRRQMTVSGSVISDGVESASVSFNYPQSGTLTDAPAFTQRTENPGGTFSYSTSDDTVAQTRTITITLPDTTQQQPTASQVLLTRSTNASSIANGLMVQSEIKRGSTSYAKSVVNYANDPGGYKQVQSVIAYDDAGAGVKTDFDYDQYGNVLNKREYGY